MHILLIHQAFAALDEPGGTRHHELARYLARRGHRVTIIASPVSYLTGAPVDGRVPFVERRQLEAGITLLRTYVYQAHHKSFTHRLIAFFSFMFSSFVVGLGVRRVDVVWGTSPPIFQGVTAWALARLKRARFLFEVRDLWPYFAVAVGVLTNRTLIRMSEWLERFLYRRADHLVVNSPGYVEHVQARGGRQVTLIPNGADAEMFRPHDDGAAFRRAHGLTAPFIAMYAGAHGLSNDLDVLLDAAALLRDEPLQIVLLGDGKEKPRLKQRAEKEGLHNVVFIEPLSKQQMPAALAAADACIAILKPIEAYKTTYPNKVFDYMAAGKAVVLAIDGVVRAVVEAAGGGVFAPPGDARALADALRMLASQPALCREMGEAGRRYVEQHFDRSALAARLADVLEALKQN